MNQFQHALLHIPPAHIAADPNQPRKHFDEAAFKDLVDSVKESGVTQPILVRSVMDPAAPGGRYIIIAGERRWRAATECKNELMPVIVRDDLSEAEILAMQITENLQRQELSLSELVASVSRLVGMHDVTQAAKKLGKEKSWVSRINGVTKLWAPVRDLIKDGDLHSVDAAHDLSTLRDIDPQRAEQLVKEFRNPPSYRATPPTRELIRAELERARTAAATKQSHAREAQETSEAQREQRQQEGQTLTQALSSGSSKTPFQQGRDELKEAHDAADLRKEKLVNALVVRLMNVLKLQQSGEDISLGFVVDRDGQERLLSLDAPDCAPNATMEEVKAFDHKSDLWRLELDLGYDELVAWIDALESKSPAQTLPARFQAVRDFVAATTVPSKGDSIKSEWLFDSYEKWCKKNKREVLTSANEFATAMEICGVAKKRTAAGRFWSDIKPVKA